MPLFLKTEKCMQILPAASALECTKLMKVGIFFGTWELDTLDLYPVHLSIIKGLVTSAPGFQDYLFVDLHYWHLLIKCLTE